MPNIPIANSYITMADMYMAYRKAKVDCFYAGEICLAPKIAEFESKLSDNLKSLRKRLLRRDWINDSNIIGSVLYSPKDISADKENNNIGTVATAPDDRWDALGKKPEIEFRAFCDSPVEWHIISALWIFKIGHKFDALLDKCSRGNRVRRVHPRVPPPPGKTPEFHKKALGSFEPYLSNYRQWRDDGLKVIRNSLNEKQNVIAITADIAKFYHSVNPQFMLEPKLLNRLDTVNKSGKKFHRDFIVSLHYWSTSNAITGLPVGFSASSIIANCLLLEFDKRIQEELNPLYYGRYVDDIFLVISDPKKLKDLEAVWNYVGERVNLKYDNLLSVTKDANKQVVVTISIPYDCDKKKIPRSKLELKGSKQKVFFLDHQYGQTILDGIENQIRETSSEWRRLPEFPVQSSHNTDLCFISHTHDATESADSLRKADAISIRRAYFAIHLRDLEAISEDVTAHLWTDTRKSFIGTVCREIISMPSIFHYANYLPRVFGLAVTAGDTDCAKQIIDALHESMEKVKKLINNIKNIKEKNKTTEKFTSCRKNLATRILIAIYKYWTYTPGSSPLEKEFGELMEQIEKKFKVSRPDWSFSTLPYKIHANSIAHGHQVLFHADLAATPYRAPLLAGYLDILRRTNTVSLNDAKDWWDGGLSEKLVKFIEEMFMSLDQKIPLPFLFPTRPFSFAELTLLVSKSTTIICGRKIQQWLQALRGTYNEADDFGHVDDTKNGTVRIPHKKAKDKITVAIPCFEVGDDSFRAAVFLKVDPTPDRYLRATRLINAIIRSSPKPDYIIFPELALPEKWFTRFALKLARMGISLISGLDYLLVSDRQAKPLKLVNQVRCSLLTDVLGYPTPFFHIQNKQSPAPGEKKLLEDFANAVLDAGGKTDRPIVIHGDLHFGILICSELTDIAARAPLRGNIDLLIIPQWNRDLRSFNALVESSAIDLHAYIIQVNNRQYGDSRVRAPAKEEWDRDIVRLKGGRNDYFAIAELDIAALRYFQTNHISPDKPFKPVPTGFILNNRRKRIHYKKNQIK